MNAWRACSVVGEVGDVETDSGMDLAGDVGAVDWVLEWAEVLECTESSSTPTTSHPSMDSVIDEESEEETKLAVKWTVEPGIGCGRDCERECSRSRSLPFREPNRRLTPKLSLRFSGLPFCTAATPSVFSLPW